MSRSSIPHLRARWRSSSFLKNSRPDLYQALGESGDLNKVALEVGRKASEMFDLVAQQMAQSPDLPQDPKERQSVVESIPLVAEEIVLHDLVYQPA